MAEPRAVTGADGAAFVCSIGGFGRLVMSETADPALAPGPSCSEALTPADPALDMDVDGLAAPQAARMSAAASDGRTIFFIR